MRTVHIDHLNSQSTVRNSSSELARSGPKVGLIVDSFGALRLDMEARENDQQTQTFISCALGRWAGRDRSGTNGSKPHGEHVETWSSQ